MSGHQLLDAWLRQHKIYRFEGEEGVSNLEKLVKTLGYTGNGFAFGTPIEEFLSDNPRACETIVEFIGNWIDKCDDWQESIQAGVDQENED